MTPAAATARSNARAALPCLHPSTLSFGLTIRLKEVVSAGGFWLARIDRDEDSYEHLLRIAVRRGRSIGDQMVAEGLARTWEGRRRPWY